MVFILQKTLGPACTPISFIFQQFLIPPASRFRSKRPSVPVVFLLPLGPAPISEGRRSSLKAFLCGSLRPVCSPHLSSTCNYFSMGSGIISMLVILHNTSPHYCVFKWCFQVLCQGLEVVRIWMEKIRLWHNLLSIKEPACASSEQYLVSQDLETF